MAYQAHDYEKAEKIFAALADSAPDSYQKAAYQYDVGLTLMAQKDWTEAIAKFQTIPLDDSSNPLLQFRLLNNIAICLFELGRSDKGAESHDLAHFVYREALSYIEDAQRSLCVLQKAEGSKECKPSNELRLLKEEIEQKLTSLPKPPPLVHPEKGSSTEQFLDYLIHRQRELVVLNRKGDKSPEEIIALQKKIVSEARELFKVAIDNSAKEFEDTKSCQAHPWDEFFPAYEKGVKSAESSIVLKGREQMYKQAEAYFMWLNAMNILKKPKSEFSGKCNQDSAEKKKIDKTFEQLEEMDQQDQQLQPVQAMQNQGGKPW